MVKPTYTLLRFDDLKCWVDDDHQAALDVFSSTCADIADPAWSPIKPALKSANDAKYFFETHFTPVLIDDGHDALFTGYFEPELRGSLTRWGPYQHPVYHLPPDISLPWLTRREIQETAVLQNRNLEIAWIDDPIDVFFLQVQGSGRVQLDTGNVIRVGYAGKNGHAYTSIGAELVKRGVFAADQISAEAIQNWVRDSGDAGRDLLYVNDSFVFFREVNEVPVERGPLGAMNRSVTPMRTIAIDPKYIPYGAPVWIEKDGVDPLNRLMIAQDTGSAIRGAQRADIFFGTGDAAGRAAGRIKDSGRLVVLMPVQVAQTLISGDIV